MSHYNIDYSAMPLLAADAKALKDMRSYLGTKSYKAAIQMARTHSPAQTRNTLAFIVGVEGYPVEALLRAFNPETIAEAGQ